MNKTEIIEYYHNREGELAVEIGCLKRRNRLFVLAELLLFALSIASVAAYTVYSNMLMLVLAVFLFVSYIIIRRIDVKNSEQMGTLTDLKSVYEKEQKYHAADYSCFADGNEYVDSKHPFTYDMDVFGQQSLFHRINRTVTKGGSDCLARCLSSLNGNKDFIDNRRSALDALSGMEAERAAFMAQGQRLQIDTERILDAVASVRKMSLSSFPMSVLSLAIAIVAIAFFAIVVVLAFCGIVSASLAVTWGTLQMFLVMAFCSKPLRDISKVVNRLNVQMGRYVELIRLIATSKMNDIADLEFPGFKVNSPDTQLVSAPNALAAFDGLHNILSAIDRRGNVLGLIFTDMFLLSDYFLVRRFLQWRCLYADKIERWINDVSTLDALVSMATFAYNEPQSGRAEVVCTKEVVYEAKGLYHPFIGDKAVRNDFSIKNNNYYIITGANMAGKSTFLRSIGINYILAQNGMPVFADSLQVSSYNLFTSMRTSDDLASGISYFNAELLRLKQLIEGLSSGFKLQSASQPHNLITSQPQTLIILDEILKGTNSLDKLNGSRMFLEAMATQSVSGIIATHDLELSKMSDERPDRFHNYCFEIELSDNITYTYKIMPGVARNQNATHLLRSVIKDII